MTHRKMFITQKNYYLSRFFNAENINQKQVLRLKRQINPQKEYIPLNIFKLKNMSKM
jgi:hypothetical protein